MFSVQIEQRKKSLNLEKKSLLELLRLFRIIFAQKNCIYLKWNFCATFKNVFTVICKQCMFAQFNASRCSKQTGSVTHPERGSVLVFLPGLYEIQYMKEALSKLVRKRYVYV